jgi:surfeit locus 1 family protein
VTPVLLDDGTAVLVQRGWMARDAQDRTRVAPPPAVPDTAPVIGRIAPALARLYEFDDSAAGPIRQNLDIDAYARETKRSLRPWVLVQIDSPSAPSDGLLRQWPAPSLGLHKNYGYAFQWFSLSVLTIFLYVWFQFIRPRRRRAA